MFYTEREREMSGFELQGDDVASTSASTSSNFGLGSTFKVGELLQAAISWVAATGSNGHANPLVKWFTVDGVKCQILRTQGGGWKSGKLVFRLEFIPDEPEVDQQSPSIVSSHPQSPLDDLRSQLNS